ncbi:hypothetical protein A3F66_06605 [candidate division TM6 bacterium RIFCSPHIGHO2_12_FULL_32_22]|nr:MAG: hypothetical protein A3F66_06605 [candidate division TM6 bacterium RIFCSPHIGHO2_12_FULL_32_22]
MQKIILILLFSFSANAMMVFNQTSKNLIVCEDEYADGREIAMKPLLLAPGQSWTSHPDALKIIISTQDNSFSKLFNNDRDQFTTNIVVTLREQAGQIVDTILYPKSFN